MIPFLLIVDLIDLRKEISSKTLEARAKLEDKLEKIWDSDQKTYAETQSQYLEGHYAELREEILKYYGNKQINAGKGKEYLEIQIPQDTKRDEDCMKITKEEDCPDYNSDRNDQNVKDEENKIDKDCTENSTERKDEELNAEDNYADKSTLNKKKSSETIPWRAKIISKFISFQEFALNYGTNPWSQVNPRNYLNSLSKRLT